MFEGIDVSSYQRSIDWPRVRAAGISYAYIKATEGVTITDPLFVEHYGWACNVEIPCGAYHFLTDADPHEQARHFVEVLGTVRLSGDLPPMLDLERGAPGLDVGARALVWLRCVEQMTGRRPLVYTGPGFAASAHLDRHPELADYELWIAHYTTAAEPMRCPPWSDWFAWQYTGSGRVDGVDGRVDLSRARRLPGALISP